MMIEVIILIVIATAILIDSFCIGLFIRFSPKFKGLKKDEKILLKTRRATGFTLKKMGPLKKLFRNFYGGVLTIILTNQRILFKPQLLTCALSLGYNDILRITEEKYLFKQYICVHYNQEGGEKEFYFCPKAEYKEWLTVLKELAE